MAARQTLDHHYFLFKTSRLFTVSNDHHIALPDAHSFRSPDIQHVPIPVQQHKLLSRRRLRYAHVYLANTDAAPHWRLLSLI